ncbi:MAG: hypothetical protein ACK5P7_07505 [Bdellovibrio sp.]
MRASKTYTVRLILLLVLVLGATLFRASRHQSWFAKKPLDLALARSFSLYLNPFRQSIEKVGENYRTEIGCHNNEGNFVWNGLSANLLGQMNGSHNFVIIPYSILSGAYNIQTFALRKKWTTELFCRQNLILSQPPCATGTRFVSLRIRDISGNITSEDSYACFK